MTKPGMECSTGIDTLSGTLYTVSEYGSETCDICSWRAEQLASFSCSWSLACCREACTTAIALWRLGGDGGKRSTCTFEGVDRYLPVQLLLLRSCTKLLLQRLQLFFKSEQNNSITFHTHTHIHTHTTFPLFLAWEHLPGQVPAAKYENHGYMEEKSGGEEWRRDVKERWCGEVVWRRGGVEEKWCGREVVWTRGGVEERWCGGKVVWRRGGVEERCGGEVWRRGGVEERWYGGGVEERCGGEVVWRRGGVEVVWRRGVEERWCAGEVWRRGGVEERWCGGGVEERCGGEVVCRRGVEERWCGGEEHRGVEEHRSVNGG